ncbi:MAG: threonyl-tRNA synthetase editing domain-containing protein [Candidatus Paceibacterota bacterium]
MKALLLHCKNYKTKITELSSRPDDIEPESVKGEEKDCQNCVVILLTVEKGDKESETVEELGKEIEKMAAEVEIDKVVILPFAHLSNNLADSDKCINIFESLEERLEIEFEVLRAHFGSHKELLLHLYGHPGNARFREF